MTCFKGLTIMRAALIALLALAGLATPAMARDAVAEMRGLENVLVFSDRDGLFERGDAAEQLSMLDAADLADANIAVFYAGRDGLVEVDFDRKSRLELREMEADTRLNTRLKLKRTRFSAVLLDIQGRELARFDAPVGTNVLANAIKHSPASS